jgi:hypothetical protein
MFIPMHFVASGFEVTEQRELLSSLEWPSRDGTRRNLSSWRMKEFADEKGIPFWEITKEGDTIEL